MNPELELFSQLTDVPPLVQQLAARGGVQRFRKGSTFIREGDKGSGIFIILKGHVRAFCLDKNNREITFGVYHPGDYVGEMALDGGPRSANVIALEPTVCSVVDQDTLSQFVSEFPQFSFDLLARVIRRARLATENARNLAFIDVYGRLHMLLCELAQPAQANGHRLIPQKYTHQELASLVGCSREMISRILKDLVRGGYIAVDQKMITLCKPLPPKW